MNSIGSQMSGFLYNNSFKFRLLRHTLFFVITVMFFSVILYVQGDSGNIFSSLRITLINSFFFFSFAYVTLFLLIPEFLLRGKIIWFFVLFLLVGVTFSALKLVVSDQIFYFSISPENIENRGIFNLRFIVVNTKDMTFIVALFCIAKFIKDYIHAEEIRKLVTIQTKEAQRKLFQSQFDPHFLFNTINNLYAISLLNPARTIEVISRIKTVLNYLVDEIQKEFVSLEGEIELVRNYIQLEKLRYGNRLKVKLNVEGNVHSCTIPPTILFSLVENSFKHSISLDAGSPWINLEINLKPERIIFIIENSKPLNAPVNNNANQLVNLRKRLDIMYKSDGYDLRINDNENSHKVFLELKHEIEDRQATYQ